MRIEVRDEDPGLSDDDKARLFGTFVRLSPRPTDGEHSTGLGLSIVKKNGRGDAGSYMVRTRAGQRFSVKILLVVACKPRIFLL